MTRRSATTNGVHTNGDGPPPSTLAAQIVQGQTRHSTSQPAGEPPPFSELLNAILHDQNAAQETDVNVNAQLVSVVTQLGLTPLTLENPFAEWDSLVSQAIDSIAVIEKTVTRQPDVLLVQLVPDGPQLALSLLASLISLCGLPKCSDVAAVGLISRLITSLASSANFWRFAHILVEVLQESVDDGLVALESLSSPNVPLNIKLPPARSISKLWPNAGSSITMPPGSNSTITEAARAFYIVVEICQVLDLYSPWQREAQHRLLDLLPKFKLQTVRSGFWARTVQVLLHFPRNWQLVQELLQDALLVLPDAQLQTGLAQSLLETLQTCEVVAKDHLLPPLYAIAEAENWASLHQDLKIAVTTWLCRYESECLLPEQISAMRIALHQDDAMTDGDLRTAFQQLSFSQIRTGRRPRERKRRKTCTNVTLDSGAVKKRTEHLNSAGVAEGTDFSRYSPAAYLALQEDEKCEVWQSLVELADQDLPTTCQTVSQLIQLPNITKQNEREYCPCWLFKHAFNTATMRSLQHSRRRIWVDIAYKVCKAPLERSESQLDKSCVLSENKSTREHQESEPAFCP